MRRRAAPVLLAALASLAGTATAQGTAAPPRSVHRAQTEELADELLRETDDAREAAQLGDRLFPERAPGLQALTTPSIDPDFIVFGYLQSESQVFHTRWNALTHVGSRFVGFDSSGLLTGTSAFTGRSSYLKSGGAAEAAGVKVILVVNNFDDGGGGDIETVMTSPGLRATLAGEIADLLAADGYAHGVSMDLEFSWGASVRDGVSAFMATLRSELDLVDPALELSIYTNAIFSATQWDFDAVTGITPSIDYMLYSMYDWATGLTAHAISDFDNCLGSTRMHAYLDDGLPPEKLVPVISAYSRRWNGTAVYNGVGSSSSSSGFTDALYDVTLNPGSGGPYPESYETGDEAGWYAWSDGTPHVRTWEGLEGFELEIRHALSMQDPNGTWSGRRLGGVGFWSLMWMAETSSIDPRTGGAVSRTRTYPHVYQLCQEILSAPGTTRFAIEGFEGLDFRWRDPNESPDTTGDTDGDSARALVATPSGPGGPVSSTNAMRVGVDLESGGANAVVFAHEVLASPLASSVTDLNAAAAHFDATTELRAFVHTDTSIPGYVVRMLAIDAKGELEASPPLPLVRSGWRRLVWDLTDAGAVAARTTSEPAFDDGDGVLDTAGGGARDLGFFGFVVEGSGAIDAEVTFDEVTYEHRDPGGRRYVVNELRYADPDRELVEIHGPAGPLPRGLVLRTFRGSDGAVVSSFELDGEIADLGDGTGLLVVGDSGVPNVDLALFTDGVHDLPDGNPSAVQLVDSRTGGVFDSVVYEAFGGLDDLVRRETRGVTDNGQPWLGEIAGGMDVSGAAYTLGRYPDGADTGVNGDDFSLMPASPGARNGNSVAVPSALDFEAPPARAFQTFQAFAVTDPTSAGLPASSNGGRAYRCVDTSGGGVIGVVGDAAIGSAGGHRVRGELWLPGAGDAAQAVAVGICGRQGSRFFGSTLTDRSAYESGYWLVFENAAGVGLADGRPDHAGVFELVHATHDNQDGEPVELLGSATLASLGLAAGTWVSFELEIDAAAAPGLQLIAKIGGCDVYRGPIPPDGPTSGAFQVGFRENHGGPPGPGEGTWIDGLRILPAGRPRAPRLDLPQLAPISGP